MRNSFGPYSLNTIFYRVGISIVSGIASLLSDVADHQCASTKRFNVVVRLLSSLPHSRHGICSFFGGNHGGFRFELELASQLYIFSTARRAFVLVVLLPPSTAAAACPRFAHTDEPWCFLTMR